MDAVIRTERLTLRPFVEDDADALFDIFRRPDVARWSGTGEPMTERDQAVQRIGRFPTRAGDHPATGIWAVVDDDTDVCRGQLMLVPLPPSTGVDRADIEVGWHLHPDVWGRGYASEAATALVERGFAAGFEELYAVTDPDNVRSQAVCRRLGMTDLGLHTEWYDQELRAFRLSR
ncbi:GNAT family N-acetyltransferase [Aeromicrobium terrae]|jgi:RimJ/RimL family protein N-acetyltransferase|uniref:GNAT family N-acetyltransferase n=1 Tax=Aeromicrobium terrae TaxID=2498846 RepID=A0A5C8NI97_9ACTN|nr:GNAT family N-acetyltransferase [Aeromicrobium terrae]TXL61489.1 GNAT family N-acetyltransferase [Aeromicrobium terrae]